jgi:hypothetical protein
MSYGPYLVLFQAVSCDTWARITLHFQESELLKIIKSKGINFVICQTVIIYCLITVG